MKNEPEQREEDKESWVYMVRCRNGSLYTGWARDVHARFEAHRTGKGARYTKAFKAVELAYAEQLPSKSEALRREAALKRLTKAQKEALCREYALRQERKDP